MNLISILSADSTSSVSVMINGKIRDKFSTDDYNSHSKVLPEYLSKVNSIYDLEDFNGISVSIGPGSYTGLRIGLSLAKGIAFSKEIPLIPITTFDIINHSIVAKGNYWILVHSHREFYFAQEYKDSKKVSNASLIDINKLGNSDVYYSGKKIDNDQKDKINIKLDSNVMLQIAMQNYKNLCVYDINSVSPNYISNVKLNKNV
tara:strand:- start:359 stop:967 length:609 start_codon:yes stop_codon:yes gene_type:complete